jgi:DNA-binding beta-propeller fold protein YncE
MRLWLAGLALLFCPAVFAQQSVPEIPFDSVPNIPDFNSLPANLYMGEGSAVTTNSKGHIFVFSRGNTTGPAYAAQASQLLEFGPDGKFIREIGHNLYGFAFAHGVRADKYDNIWTVDKGTDMIVKFNPAGRPVMVFGRRQEASDEGTGPLKHPNPPLPAQDMQFRQPTDVTFDAADNVYISDGYVNSRVAKIDKNGVWVKQWGDRGSAPGQFNSAHNITSDSQGNIYVADRSNRRIQVFDGDGKFLRQFQVDLPFDPSIRSVIGNTPPQGALNIPGAPWVVCVPPGGNVIYTADSYPGRVYKLSLDGKLLGVLGQAGRLPKQFGWIHGMACPSENTLFVAEIINWRVQKLVLHPKGEMGKKAAGQS